MEELSIPYFRDLLDKHIKELKNFCQEWKDSISDNSIPEEVVDEIRTTVGLTNLLLRQKLKQFGQLIDDSEFKRGEKEITCIDLQGFWDMVYHEVEKIRKSFKKLEKCQSNNWVFIEEPVPKLEAKKKPTIAAVAKITIQSKAHAIAARQRLAQAKVRMLEAKKKMKEAKNDAKDIVILESNPIENGVSNIAAEKTIGSNEQLITSAPNVPLSKPTIAAAAEITIQSKAHATAARQRLAQAKVRMLEAKKKMKEAKNDAKEDIVILEANPIENGASNIAAEKIIGSKVQLKPVLVTIEDKESVHKTSKRSMVKSNKKTALSQEMNGHQKRLKSERILKGKENLVECDKKIELLPVLNL